MLFADQLDAGAQTLAVGGWIGGALSVIGTVVNAIISARTARDRMAFDSEKQRMGWRIGELEKDVQEGREAEERCRAELAAVRAELKSVTDYLLRVGVPAGAITPAAKKE